MLTFGHLLYPESRLLVPLSVLNTSLSPEKPSSVHPSPSQLLPESHSMPTHQHPIPSPKQARPPRLHRLNLPLRPPQPPKPLRQLTPIKQHTLRRFYTPQLMPTMPPNGTISHQIRRWRWRRGFLAAERAVLLRFGAVCYEGVGEGFAGGSGVGVWGWIGGFWVGDVSWGGGVREGGTDLGESVCQGSG